MIALWWAARALAWDPANPEVHVETVERGAISVNGTLDEPDWARATPITDLLRHRPSPGGPPPCSTEVRFLQDERNLYVGARVYGCDYRIRARVTAREEINEDDQIGVYFDTEGDGRTGYLFYLNPHGVQQDIRSSNGEWSFSWNAAFLSRGHVTEDGYEIEIAFPWRSLKYPSGAEEQTWGVVVTRVVPHLGAKYSFPRVEDGHPRVMTLAAPLTGVRPPGRGSGLELIPGLTAGQAWPRDDGSTTGLDRWDQILRPSLDARFGIRPDIGLTAAINPDFSQVEADVPDVRVNPRFAYYFPETRPLFLDGFEYYEDRSDTLYTRSINAPLYGAKLSGEEGPFSVGLLNALDKTPLPTFNVAGSPGFDADDVEGRESLVSVFRGRVDAFDDGFVGVTYADKRLLGDPDHPRRSAGSGVYQAGAADVEAPFGDRWLAGASTQHSFTGVEDGPRTWGMKNEAAIERTPGRGTGFELALADITPGHRAETGYAPQSGVTTGFALLDHRFEIDRFVDTATPGVEAEATLERDGDRLVEVGPEYEMKVADVHAFDLSARAVDQVEQGVPFRGWNAAAAYESNPAAWLILAPEAEIGREIDYDLLVGGDALLLAWYSALIPTAGTRIDTLASWERFDPDTPGPAGRPRTAVLVRNKLNWQFTRDLGLRVIGAWQRESGEDPELQSSVLLTWLRVPGTAAYVGWSETTDLAGGAMVERSVFAKVSVLIRP